MEEPTRALEPKQQDRFLNKAIKENWSRKELRQAVREYRHSERARLFIETALGQTGRFGVICADPPWEYDFSKSDSRAIENQYPTMSIEEICALPISVVTLDDCVLFLWVPAPKLREAFKVLEARGFEYRTNAVWDKQVIGMGYYFRSQHGSARQEVEMKARTLRADDLQKEMNCERQYTDAEQVK